MRNGLWTNSILIGIAILIFCSLITPSSLGNRLSSIISFSHDTLDQENSDWANQGYHSDFGMAQSFKPTLRMLTRVELMVWNDHNPHGNFTVSIRDNLNNTDLTSITLPVEDLPQNIKIWTEFDFPDIQVTPEQTYYIVCMYEPQNSHNATYWGFTGSGDNYTRGELWSFNNQTWTTLVLDPGCDFLFKTYGFNFKVFLVVFGLVTINGTIDEVFDENFSLRHFFYCKNVSKVTVIGFGIYANDADSKLQFYMKSFTNVSELVGATFRKLEPSDEYQHFTIYPFRFRPCAFLIYEE
jgi:hypothetical protein